MANFTSPLGLTHGFLNPSHTSNITLGWTPSSLPTPFPIVIVSSLVSIITACVGWKTAMITGISPERLQERLKRPPGFNSWTWRERFEWSRRRSRQDIAAAKASNNAPLDPAEDVLLQLPGKVGAQEHWREDQSMNSSQYSTGYEPMHVAQASVEQFLATATTNRWEASTRNKVSVLISVFYNTLRAVVAMLTTLDIAITRHGTHAAMSSLFLYLSLQTFIANRKLPRIILIVVVFDLFLVGTAFLVATWDLGAAGYGDATLIGGSCPVFADDCAMQAPHWSQVGCGSVIRGASSSSGSVNPNPNGPVYPPYSNGDVNDQYGNRLRSIEGFVGVLGSFWTVVTLLATLYEAWRVFGTIETLSHLLWPVPFTDEYRTSKKTGRRMKRLGWSATGLFALFSFGGSFIVLILSIAGHASGETRIYGGSYIDSFGPAVTTNITNAPAGAALYTTSGGNATSWSDCFNITTPTSSNGFFDIWLSHNEQETLRPLRIIALL